MKNKTKSLDNKINFDKIFSPELKDEITSIYFDLTFSRIPSNGYKKFLKNAWKKAKKNGIDLPRVGYLRPNLVINVYAKMASVLYNRIQGRN